MSNKKISSKVRKALAEGKIKEANGFLGNAYSLRGIVVKGQQLGRVLGYPTANLNLHEESRLFLANGVYAVNITIDGKEYGGMANIGIRPTLDQHELTVEVNIFSFDGDIYGKEILLHFIERIRDEKKFGNLEELKDQLSRDKEHITELLSSGVHSDTYTK
ncbi:MAG: hypothetical protein NTX61_06060 [Bacteroidetes bacterium]|nr:hypothetical protein [Bacteroidota bacterium]